MFHFIPYNLECSIYTMNVVCQNQICLSVRNGMKNKFPQALHRTNQDRKIKSHDGNGETDNLFMQICLTQKLNETVFI